MLLRHRVSFIQFGLLALDLILNLDERQVNLADIRLMLGTYRIAVAVFKELVAASDCFDWRRDDCRLVLVDLFDFAEDATVANVSHLITIGLLSILDLFKI